MFFNNGNTKWSNMNKRKKKWSKFCAVCLESFNFFSFNFLNLLNVSKLNYEKLLCFAISNNYTWNEI